MQMCLFTFQTNLKIDDWVADHVYVYVVSAVYLHNGQTHNARAVPAIILQRKIGTNVESFTLTAKLNAISENLSFLR